jgi:hypothetical protein
MRASVKLHSSTDWPRQNSYCSSRQGWSTMLALSRDFQYTDQQSFYPQLGKLRHSATWSSTPGSAYLRRSMQGRFWITFWKGGVARWVHWIVLHVVLVSSKRRSNAGDAPTLHPQRLRWSLLNSANVVVLPKKETISQGDYWPKSLMHSVAKKLAKVLANRLAPHVQDIISDISKSEHLH